MSLKGELTDLSLAELIEFFCNQRKTGRLTVSYPQAPAYFYLQSGSVVHASVGSLRGIEAVFYALTQSNASFNFSTAYEPPAQTINQPWTSVVLEGLRRMDEGIQPRNPFSGKSSPEPIEAEVQSVTTDAPKPKVAAPIVSKPSVFQSEPESPVAPFEPPPAFHTAPAVPLSVVEPASPIKARAAQPVKKEALVKPKEEPVIEEQVPSISRATVSDSFLASTQRNSKFSSGPWKLAAVFAALILIVAGIAVPWGWRVRGKAAKAAEPQTQVLNESAPPQTSAADNSQSASAEVPADQTSAAPATADAADAARREREARAREEARLKAKAAEANAAGNSSSSSTQTAPSTSAAQSTAAGPKKATVTVTYDENGRVTGASGSDPTALRIARQKRFPPGKAGSATITIPIN